MSAGARGAPAPPGPFFSVIITAYNRRRFLLRAVDSVLAQSEPRDAYEIIVVKNFEDEAIDRELAAKGVITLLRAEAPLGIHLGAALERVRGEVVAFLNDDDRWAPERLAAARARFANDPRLGFYATSYRVIDEEDRPLPAERDRFTAVARFAAAPGAIFRVAPDSPPEELERFVRANPGSDSTIAIRSAILRGFRQELCDLPSSVDTFMLTLGFLSGLDLVIEYRPLTLLRVHAENMSRATDVSCRAYLAKYARTMGGFAAATAFMVRMTDPARFPWLHRRLAAKFHSLDHFARMADGSLGRIEAMRGLGQDLRHRPPEGWGLVSSELLYTASPTLSQAVNFLVGRRIAGA
jgi:glycosyltransferase involved in cell wall biosynthesis